jgi:hypothetical protein
MLTPTQIEAFLQDHIPHRLILLTTFRDRQAWFDESFRAERRDGDLLRVSKDSALISIRMFANFLGLRLKAGKLTEGFTSKGKYPNDVNATDLGGRQAMLSDISTDERTTLEGLLNRGDKELAHLTSNFTGHDDYNTEEAFKCGIDLVERLLREKVYNQVVRADGTKYPFPDLANEKRIWGTGYELRGGPLPPPSFPRQ